MLCHRTLQILYDARCSANTRIKECAGKTVEAGEHRGLAPPPIDGSDRLCCGPDVSQSCRRRNYEERCDTVMVSDPAKKPTYSSASIGQTATSGLRVFRAVKRLKSRSALQSSRALQEIQRAAIRAS